MRDGTKRWVGWVGTVAATAVLSACSSGSFNLTPAPSAASVAKASLIIDAPAPATSRPAAAEPLLAFAPHPSAPSDIDALVVKYAAHYDVPASLIHRVIRRESTYNPRARNGPYMGLMQISTATAKSMGYRGSPEGLLDADTNLKYAVKYLRGAWIVGGYYYDAKAKGLLKEVGLR